MPSAKRIAGLPNVPTLKEQGFDIHAGGLRGFVAPAGIPRDAAKVLEDTLAKVHKSAAWREYMARNMYEDVYMNAEELSKWLASQQVGGPMRIRLQLLALSYGLIAGWVAPSFAQPYPSRPIELVSSTGAGGGSDLVCRIVADIIAKEKLLPQQVFVVNKPGGGGAVGQTYVAARRGDPYVFMLASTNLVAAPIRTGLDIGVDKFQTLGAIGFDPNAISVAENSPYRTLKDLLAAARDKPKTISVGTTSPGGGAHSMMHRLEKLSGARFNIVSFKSGAETVTAVMGGHIQVTAENLGEVLGQVENKKVTPAGRAVGEAYRRLAQRAYAEGTGV